MSGTLTPYGRELLLKAVFMPEDYVTLAPSGLWMAYARTVPVANSDGSQLDETPDSVTDPRTGFTGPSGYLRAPAGALSNANWDWSGFAEVFNLNQLQFAAALGPWGLQVGWALCDSEAVGSGNCVAVGTIIEPFQVDEGDEPFIDVAGLAIGLYD